MRKRVIFTLTILACTIIALCLRLAWPPCVKVAVATSRRGDINVTVKASGRIEPASSTEVYCAEENVLSSLKVNEGDYVDKGTPIAELADGTVLKSPVSGVVNLINVKVGLTVSPLQPVAVIGDTGKLVAKVNIPESQASKVKIGQKAEISCPAAGNEAIHGTVSFIAPSAKTLQSSQGTTTTVEATIDISQGADGLKSGCTAEASILTEHRSNSVIVPFDALSNYNGRAGVWLEKNGYAYFEPVDTGAELELETEIKSGLNGGENVILDPPKELFNGSRVVVGR